MKKYKLIKTYPSSPKLNTVVDFKYSEDMYGFSVYKSETTSDWKEFWEEVIE